MIPRLNGVRCRRITCVRLFALTFSAASANRGLDATGFNSVIAGSVSVRGGEQAMSTSTDEHSKPILGGGAINERERLGVKHMGLPQREKVGQIVSSYNPNAVRSHLWHALEGLDRYPHYLSRWNIEDMEQLEGALEAQLEKVRKQKHAVSERRRGIREVVLTVQSRDSRWNDLLTPPKSWEELRATVLDDRVSSAIFRSKQFRPKHKETAPLLSDVLAGLVQVELDPASLEDIMDQELFDVYSFPLLSKEFCDRLRSFVQEVTKVGMQEEDFAHLQLGQRPVDLDSVGLGWLNDLLLHLVMRPLARLLYKESETLDELDWRQGYVAGYSASPKAQKGTTRHRLVAHTDDSEVTLNLCIGDDFDGGALQFRGLRGESDGKNALGEYQPELGRAVLHAGRHLHEVTQVTSGNRYAYIVWARSWSGSRSKACPCCWLNRRQDKSCIMDSRWN